MNIVVFGATGGTGQRLLEQAALMGHSVTAVARNPQAVLLKHPNLQVKQGNVYNAASLMPVIAGQDVVISCLGVKFTKALFKVPTIFSEGTGNVIKAMQDSGVKRLICVSSAGVNDDPSEKPPYRYVVKPLVLDRLYQDMRRMEQIITQSGLDWIIVRPGFLTNGPLTGNYRVEIGKRPVGSWKISRADVAHFILNQLTSEEYLRTDPALGY